jgi:hypothetical protein
MDVSRVSIHLAENEWGNREMARIARQYAAEQPARPLIVHVCEHTGWWLSFLFGAPGVPEAEICGTANDMASLSRPVEQFRPKITRVIELGEIRRPVECGA